MTAQYYPKCGSIYKNKNSGVYSSSGSRSDKNRLINLITTRQFQTKEGRDDEGSSGNGKEGSEEGKVLSTQGNGGVVSELQTTDSFPASDQKAASTTASRSTIWFALWRDGELAIEATKVFLSAESIIDDLKRAIHDTVKSMLDDVAPAELTIYEPQVVLDDDALANFVNGKFGRKIARMGSPIHRDISTSDIKPILVVVPNNKTDPDAVSSAPKLIPFDESKTPLLPLNQVPVLSLDSHEPKHFCTPTPDWLDTCVSTIISEASKDDIGVYCQPVAFVRCSRGGKSRTLKEIQRRLHGKRFGNTVMNAILVSFNNFSSVRDHERLDPLAALCRRIVFAAMADTSPNPRQEDFISMGLPLNVRPEQIISWLGSDPCVLLIDDINLLVDADTTPAHKYDEFALFLQNIFLSKMGRYLVFTSHKYTRAVTSYKSSRAVLLERRPSLSHLKMAHEELHYPTLTATLALFYGRIPALIWEHRPQGLPTRHDRLETILDNFTQTCDEESVRRTYGT